MVVFFWHFFLEHLGRNPGLRAKRTEPRSMIPSASPMASSGKTPPVVDKNLEVDIAVGTICIGARANPQESHNVHNSYLRSTVHIYSMFGIWVTEYPSDKLPSAAPAVSTFCFFIAGVHLWFLFSEGIWYWVFEVQ